MDYSLVRKVDCVKDNPNSDLVQKTWMNVTKNFHSFKSIIYPETNNNNFIFNKFKTQEEFYDSIIDNIIKTNETKIIKEINPEVILLKNKEKYEIKIDVKFNEELSNERNQIINQK